MKKATQEKPFDYFYDKIWNKWYTVKALPKAEELDQKYQIVKEQIDDLKEELKRLPVNAISNRELAKEEVYKAIKAGAEIDDFESTIAKAVASKKKQLETAIAEKEIILEAVEEIKDEAWLEAYKEELSYLKPEKEKIVQELEKKKEELKKELEVSKVSFGCGEGSKLYAIEQRISWLMNMWANTTHKRFARHETARLKKVREELKAKGHDFTAWMVPKYDLSEAGEKTVNVLIEAIEKQKGL